MSRFPPAREWRIYWFGNLPFVITTNLLAVIPTKSRNPAFEFQSFPINCLSIECLDSRLRGNDGFRCTDIWTKSFIRTCCRHSHESGNPVFRVSLSFPINCLSIECLDSCLRGNDEFICTKPASRLPTSGNLGFWVSVFSDKLP